MTAPGKPTMAVTMMRVRDAAETPHIVRAQAPIMRSVSAALKRVDLETCSDLN